MSLDNPALRAKEPFGSGTTKEMTKEAIISWGLWLFSRLALRLNFERQLDLLWGLLLRRDWNLSSTLITPPKTWG